METEPSEAWIQPVDDLEKALVAVRSGPKVNSRKNLEEVVEKLRIRVSAVSPIHNKALANSVLQGHLCFERLPYQSIYTV